MLILFHPFSHFNDLYDGISWESSYSNYTFEDDAVFVRNIEEMHVGITERDDSGVRDGENDDNDELSSENDDEDIDFTYLTEKETEKESSIIDSIFFRANGSRCCEHG